MNLSSNLNEAHRRVLQRYGQYLPLTEDTPIFTLGEGDTPLVQSRRIADRINCGALYFKLEMCNPTGSFKDHGMVVVVAKAIEAGLDAVLCASTGNTSASAAAYAARCGLNAYVIIPGQNVAQGKLAQAIAYGAQILEIDGNFDQALSLAQAISEKHPIALVNSVNPYRIEGQKTAAFEIVDALGDAPDYLVIPVGNAGNITAYWRGFVEYHNLGIATQRPRMMGFQAAGAAPIVLGRPVEEPQTVASAIRIGNPASWKNALAAEDESGGAIDAVPDDEILEAYRLLAQEEGIFCEPASAITVAGLLKMSREGVDFSDKSVVCIITGNGLKDPDTAMKIPTTLHKLPASLRDIELEMGFA
jgi:threonine synthase